MRKLASKSVQFFLLLLAVLIFVPNAAIAQERYRSGSEYRQDRSRGQIQITNDWRDTVTITMWTHNRERIGTSWDIAAGETAYLAVDEDRIRVRPNYKIKVGEDWGWVNVSDVAEFRRGVWYANVRDIWRATHQRGDRQRQRRDWNNNDDDTPDWRR